MEKKKYSFYSLAYFLKNFFIVQTKNKIFLEKILSKNSKNINFFFLVLTMILRREKNFDTTFFSLIWIKNYMSSEFENFSYESKFKTLVIMIDFIESSPFKIYCQLFDIFFKIFHPKTKLIYETSFVLKKIEKKLELKTKMEYKKEFLLASLKILEFLLSFFFNDLNKSMKKILIKLWKIIGGFKLLESNLTFDSCLISILKNFQIIYNKTLANFGDKENQLFILGLISLLRDKKNDKFFEVLDMKLEEKIYSFVLFISNKNEEEFTVYIPVFFKFAFMKKLKNNKKTFASLKWIFFLANSINFKIFFRFDFLSFNLPFLILFLMRFKHKMKTNKFNFFFKFVSFEEKIFFQNRHCMLVRLIDSLKFEIKKKIFIFFFQKLFFIENKLNIQFHTFSMKFAILFLKKNGNPTRGIFTSSVGKNYQKILIKYSEIFFYVILSHFFIDYIDFFVLYRYQLPIRNLSDIILFMCEYLEQQKIQDVHSLIMIERFICLRGNDGKQILMFFFQKKKREYYLLNSYKLFNIPNITDKNQEFLCKLILRLSINSDWSETFIKEKISTISFSFLEHIIFKNLHNLSSQYILETIFLDTLSKQYIGPNFFRKIFNFGILILISSVESFIPFVFDIFEYLVNSENKAIFCLIKKHVIPRLFHPYVWKLYSLSKTTINFLSAVIRKQNNIFEKREIIILFTIAEIYLMEFGETEELFFFIISLIDNFNKNTNFIPHLIEMFFKYFSIIRDLNSVAFLNDFIGIMIEKKGIYLILKEFEKLKKNFFWFLLQNIFFENFRKKISSIYIDNFTTIFKIFLLQDISFLENIYFEKLFGRIIRKFIFDIKETKKIEKKTENIRFYQIFSSHNKSQNSSHFKNETYLRNTLEKLTSFSLFFPFRIKLN